MRVRLIRRALGGGAALTATVVLAGCGSSADSGGMTAADRYDAQSAMNALQDSNIPTQLVALTATAGLAPAACRVHLESTHPTTFRLYVFWVPFVSPQAYSWLDARITPDSSHDTFHLGTAPTVQPGGVQMQNGQMVAPPLNDYDTPLSQYGSQQARRNHQVLMAKAGDAFAKPGENCQVLKNGYLRLLPNP